MDPVLQESNQKIQAVIEHFKHDLASIRAGRANPMLIEDVQVEAYDSRLKLSEVGSISAPQQNLLTVQIWDAGIMPNVVKAIQEANLGLNPSFEGQLIRLPIPQLTSDRRAELIKMVHQKVEEAKISFRQVRQEIREDWQKSQKADEFGEDEFQRREKILQELLDKSAREIESLGKSKEAELAEV